MDESSLFWTVKDDTANMYLTFQVEETEYAVSIACVTEIVTLPDISAVPDVPPFIKGVINLRGRVIPVMDVRLRFGLPPQPYTDRTPVIVLEVEDVPTGLIVDQVSEVVEIAADQVDPPPRWGSKDKESVIQGLGKRDERVAVILDVNRLLFDRELYLPAPDELQAAVTATAQTEDKPEQG